MIDWNRIAELREDIGPEDFEEVFELFLDEVHGVIEKLRNCPDASDLESDLHFLKGSAMNLGFANFSEKCYVGERLAADGRSDRIDIAAILDCYDRSLAEFTQDLPKKFAA
ncbi:Hpt domain-containing protein [Thalassovita aquimarina]|uniref:Hpt domain-containing protein n=1 Tax=Thalassovita aquimarina TaxID=2785917 RepID=A0ABS5HNR0_9RHOB|nr:Hpt domain-containing protein [Thalassovita aquimarina]MBR9650441.1 Hpt domain-containing protein [Thalassovita aquimarina]